MIDNAAGVGQSIKLEQTDLSVTAFLGETLVAPGTGLVSTSADPALPVPGEIAASDGVGEQTSVADTTLPTPEMAPTGALTNAPVGLIETGREQAASAVIGNAGIDRAATNSQAPAGVSRGVAALQPGVPLLSSLQVEATALNGSVVTTYVLPVLFGQGEQPKTGASASGPILADRQTNANSAPPYVVDRVFETLSEVGQTGQAPPTASNVWPDSWETLRGDHAAVETDWLQDADPLLFGGDKAANDLDVLDSYFALATGVGGIDGE